MDYFHKKTALIKIPLIIAITTIGCFVSTSCSSISSATSKTKNLTKSSVSLIGKAGKKTTGIAKSSVSSLSNIIPSSRIPIAKVNAESLQTIPTGQERALAYQKKLNAKKYAALDFLRPSNYKPAKLPTVNDDPSVTTSLLPPLLPN